MYDMKKSIYLLGLLGLCITGGCTSDVDDVFEQNASTRVSQAMNECKTLLTAAPNGWQIAYYPDENQSYGGYVFLAKFDANGNVTVSGGLENDPSEKVTSHYSILSSNSATLAFDTYNTLFHEFSDPDLGRGSTYGGDFEFTYVQGDASEMVFQGTKTGNRIVFTAMDAAADWSEYLTDVAEMENKIIVSPYYAFEFGDYLFQMDDSFAHVLTYAPDPSKPEATESVAYCYTPDGISLYEPIELGGTQARSGGTRVQHFRWDEAGQQLVPEGEAVGSVTLKGVISEEYVPYDTFVGEWKLAYSAGTINVKLVPVQEGVSMTLTGFPYDIAIGYSKRTGKLSMTTQYLGNYGSLYSIYLCPWDCDTGYLTWTSGIGFDLAYNGDESNPEILFEDNGAWAGYTVSGMLFYAFDQTTGARAGYLYRYPYLDKLYK